MPLRVYRDMYTREAVSGLPGVFIFGDNVYHKGRKGQAVIRDLPNAFGIPTKWAPARLGDCYFSDDDSRCQEIVDSHLRKVEEMLIRGQLVWWPFGGIGTGLAEWQTRAPNLLKHVNDTMYTFKRDYEDTSHL